MHGVSTRKVDDLVAALGATSGISKSEAHHQRCVVDAGGTRHSQFRVTHDVAGLNDVDAELTDR